MAIEQTTGDILRELGNDGGFGPQASEELKEVKRIVDAFAQRKTMGIIRKNDVLVDVKVSNKDGSLTITNLQNQFGTAMRDALGKKPAADVTAKAENTTPKPGK